MTKNALAPIHHPNRDFFVCDVFDVLPFIKDDMASMEHPVFSLSTKPDHRLRHYEHNGDTLDIKPGFHGMPTIHDKDVLLYCASYLKAAINDGRKPNRKVRFAAYDFLVSTNRRTNGQYYQNFKMALERLAGTRLVTNIKTGGVQIEKGFGIIDSWEAVKEDGSGRVIAAEITLSEWTYNAILSNELLTINRDYFRLRKPLERRIYELARKHCGDQKSCKISLEKLHKKVGSTTILRKFRAQIIRITETNHLPDYSFSIADNIVIIKNKNCNTHAQKTITSQTAPLHPAAIEAAKEAAPGIDVYEAEAVFNEWRQNKEEPRNMVAAFAGFCRKRAKKLGLIE